MRGHDVTNPVKIGRVFVLRGARGVPPSVATAMEGTWVELLTAAGEHRRIEVGMLGRAVTLPGYSATSVDLGGALVAEGPRIAAVRGILRGPARRERALAQADLRVFLQAALLDLIGASEADGVRPGPGSGAELSRQEAAVWSKVRPQTIDVYRQRGAFQWRVENGRVLIDGASFEAWLLARLQRERAR